jgi:hypothetical protein
MTAIVLCEVPTGAQITLRGAHRCPKLNPRSLLFESKNASHAAHYLNENFRYIELDDYSSVG